jgi:catechol 2,3-dioxygenase-like lactoylglutathione lyase family enzyme
MRTLNYVLLSVRSPQASAKLYTQLLGVSPVQDSEGFVLYVLPTGLKIGLWQSTDMKPAPRPSGGAELSFTEPSREAVLATYEAWRALDLNVVMEPTDLPFGFSFVVEDPDGHRLRPFVLADRPR